MIVAFTRQPLGWPPDVTRRQLVGDVELLLGELYERKEG